MDEYIEREALINAIATSTEPFTTGLVFRAINNQPAADVASVKIGFWKISGVNPANNVIGNFKCSLCARTSLEDSDYCPNCGAKMEVQNG
jgi:hypothetical protein